MSEGGRIEPGPGWRRPVMSTEEKLDLIHDLAIDQNNGVTKMIFIGPFALYELISALQLAWRHPDIPPDQRARMELLGRNLSDVFGDPVRLALEDGWVR